jgi:hypothetical protein
MGQQMTLGGAPISDHEIETAESKAAIAPGPKREHVEIESDSGWTQPYVLKATKQEKDEGMHTQQIQLLTESDLDGVRYELSFSETLENPHGFLGSMWGSGGEDNTINADSIKKVFAGFMEEKLEEQKTPYRKFKNHDESWTEGSENEYYFYRLVPLKNYVVILNPYKKLVQMFNDVGFDFEAWNKEYMAIEENPASDEYNAKVQSYRELYKKGQMFKDQAQKILESIRAKLGMTERYDKKLNDIWPDRGLDALKLMLDGKKAEIKKINKELGDIKKLSGGHGTYDDIIGISWLNI